MFKVGERVVCINDAPEAGLLAGQIYIVYRSSENFISVRAGGGGWLNTRFRSVNLTKIRIAFK